jgi:hypothetical protein
MTALPMMFDYEYSGPADSLQVSELPHADLPDPAQTYRHHSFSGQSDSPGGGNR